VIVSLPPPLSTRGLPQMDTKPTPRAHELLASRADEAFLAFAGLVSEEQHHPAPERFDGPGFSAAKRTLSETSCDDWREGPTTI
jgi:hypothetical protein